jgi:hypothetical protein
VRTSVAAQSAEGAQLAGAESPKVKCEPFAPANTGGFAFAVVLAVGAAEAEATRGALDLGAGGVSAVGSADGLTVLAGGAAAAEADASALKATELAGIAALETGEMEVTEEGDAGAAGPGVGIAGSRERRRNAPRPPSAARSETILTMRFIAAIMSASDFKCKLLGCQTAAGRSRD